MHPTLLIGLDGATFTVLDPLMESGVMPFLARFVRTGVRAGLTSTAHPLTPPAWTTVMTGRSPGHHGVFDFIWAEERGAEHYFTLYNFRDIRSETIWSMVSRQNGRASTLNFPMMSPPPEIAGHVVPGFTSWRHLRRHVHPRSLYDQMKALPGFDAKELAWDFDLEKKAETGVAPEEYEAWVDFHMKREQQWYRVAEHLMRKEPSDLTAILFDGPDKLMHMGYRFVDPSTFPAKPTEFEVRIREQCLAYFRGLDAVLEKLVTLAGPDARVVMVSDHGFGPSRLVFRVNTWLAENGYLVWRDLTRLDEKDRAAAQKVAERHFVLLEWNKTTAYARSATSNGIFIRTSRAPGDGGVPPEQYGAFRAQLIERLLAVTHPQTGAKIVKEVLVKEESFPGPHAQQAPDLTLVMADHSFISVRDKSPAVIERDTIEGTHYPIGIFLAGGPGIRRGVCAPSLPIVDVAPCVLYCLGLPVPQDLEGTVPEPVFEPSLLAERPCVIGEPTRPPAAAAVEQLKPEEEDLIYKQMKALGYIN